MNVLIVDSQADLVGNGKERNCFVHPEDPEKAIKIVHADTEKQTKRELSFYKTVRRRKNVSFKHIPRYYGKVDTNLGRGYVFDMIRDYDGRVSRSLLWYLQEGRPLSDFKKDLKKLKKYLLENQLIFNHDMYAGNILYKRVSPSKGRLIIIDGFGDTVFIKWLNLLPSHRIEKIKRRWKLFINRLKRRAENLSKGLPFE